MIVEDFDSTLELIRGDIGDAWNAGETLGIRLTAPNLDTNTLKDDHMTIADSDEYPVTVLGDPVTLHNVANAVPDLKNGQNSWEVNDNTHVATLTTTNQAVNVTITLTRRSVITPSGYDSKTLHPLRERQVHGHHRCPAGHSRGHHHSTPTQLQFQYNQTSIILQFPVQTGEDVDGIFTITFTAVGVTEEM